MAVKFSVKITRGAAPLVDIAPQMWTLSGCFGFGLNLCGWPTLNHHTALIRPYDILELFSIYCLLQTP